MKPTNTILVAPRLPANLSGLDDIARNLRWCWNHGAIMLFRRLDDTIWEASGHNPVRMLGMLPQETLEYAATDESFIAHLDRVYSDLMTYRSGETSWYRRRHLSGPTPLVAFFCAEYGITECVRIFAGGLGILSGDYLKSASDLGVPMIGIGLLYNQNAGADFYNLPVKLQPDKDGKPLTVKVSMPGRDVAAQVWVADVGRVKLYLMDANVTGNSAEDREITAQLYGGAHDMRIKQEILLGIGGLRVLAALGQVPPVCHMNEGHTAFVALERTRMLMREHNITFAQARPLATAGLVFSTHTPEAAGHDYFAADVMERYFRPYAAELGLSFDDFMNLGRVRPGNAAEWFCMTVLAIRMSAKTNGVSKMHGVVSRNMWQGIWPDIPVDEVPITHITNGVHFRTWMSREMNGLYDRYLGPRWSREAATPEVWAAVERIPRSELWAVHQERRERLVNFVRRRLKRQLERRGMPENEVAIADEVLDPSVLTICFARRFVPYKRINLLLRDPERLDKIVNNPQMPVQIVFAGNIFVGDPYSSSIVQNIVGLARQEKFRRRLVLLEGYDLGVARTLVQGTDIWLNNPRRGHEACGTSGMKAAANGGLNLSTLDGWWDEAWEDSFRGSKPVGWCIGNADDYEDWNEEDAVDANALYQALEQDVVPAFYDRGTDRIPHRWIDRMKASIQTLAPYFNSHRAVREYLDLFYMPGADHAAQLAADSAALSRAAADAHEQIALNWPKVKILSVETPSTDSLAVGDRICLTAKVLLGALSPDYVVAEVCLGKINAAGDLVNPVITSLLPSGDGEDGVYVFRSNSVACTQAGISGYTVRVRANHPDLSAGDLLHYVTWASAM